MRSLQYMLDNWEKMEYETLFEAKHERYYRAIRGCKRNHPPIRVVQNGQCAICQKASQKVYNDKAREKRQPEIRKRREAEGREKERTKIFAEEREKAMKIKHRCETLDKIKTGILYFVKGKCAA